MNDEQLTTQNVEICVVKRCLFSALSCNLLDASQRAQFIQYIEDCTDLASRMARRASLAFLYYVVRRQEMGLTIPDFGKATDGYWLQWMRTGLLEFGVSAYPTLVTSAKTKTKSDQALQSDQCKEIDQRIFSEIDGLLGTTLGPVKRTIPKYFDRIVGHMAKQFATAVDNTLSVNFFKKLQRVCRYEVAESGIKDFSGYDLLVATCNGGSNCGSQKVLPEELRPFVDGVRGALGVEESAIVYENSSFDFPSRFAVHWFLQQRLELFGRRKLMLSPVHKVQRMHVRLDATHLGLIMNDLIWTPVAKKVAEMMPRPLPLCPTRKTHPEIEAFKASKSEWVVLKAEYTKQHEAYQEAKAKLGTSPLSKIANEKTENPEMLLAAQVPIPVVKKPNHLTKDDPTWTKKLRPEMQRLRDEAVIKRSTIRKTRAFQDAMTKYKDYETKACRFALGLFTDFKDRNPKLGWKPSGSVMTDGVSLCVTYERTVTKVNKTCKEESEEFVNKKKAKKKETKDASDLEPYDDYDTDANTCHGDALVLGIDPGRVCIVTIVCIDEKGVKTSWRLTRGQFHTESGILKQNKLQSRRYSPLAADFASLTADGGALRASSSDQVRRYIGRYKQFEDRWFTEFALKQKESRAKMKRFLGKQKTLSSFFSRVRKDAEKIMVESGKKRLEVAYGACGPTMACTGRGEMSVPTKGAYGACIRAFTKERETDCSATAKNVVSLENEEFTSKMSWFNGNAYEKVYKKYDTTGKEFLYHTAGKGAPFVKKEEDLEGVLKKRAENKIKASMRRGGRGFNVPLAPTSIADARDAKMTRHIDVRGLLFCPERRMFFARDDESARAIAGLRCIRLSGLGRPSAFRRKKLTTAALLPCGFAATTEEAISTFEGSSISEEEGGCDQSKSQPTDGAACTPHG